MVYKSVKAAYLIITKYKHSTLFSVCVFLIIGCVMHKQILAETVENTLFASVLKPTNTKLSSACKACTTSTCIRSISIHAISISVTIVSSTYSTLVYVCKRRQLLIQRTQYWYLLQRAHPYQKYSFKLLQKCCGNTYTAQTVVVSPSTPEGKPITKMQLMGTKCVGAISTSLFNIGTRR